MIGPDALVRAAARAVRRWAANSVGNKGGSSPGTPCPRIRTRTRPGRADEARPGRALVGSDRRKGQRTNSEALDARSRKYCGSRPRPSVTTTPNPIAVAVKALGIATVGPPGWGSEKNISTMTRM